MHKMENQVPRRVANTIMNALKGGVVPRIGLEYITVGRTREIDAILHDIDIVQDGGASFRFIVGKYGAGKSFLLQTIRNYATAKGFVVMDADLSPERRFAGTKGQGLATYKELVRNVSVKSKPDGGALPLVLERWISGIQSAVAQECEPGSSEFDALVEKRIYRVTGELEGMVNGFEFARALTAYHRAYREDDALTKSNVLRWFRGEYATRKDAKADLGINWIVTDETWYDFLKILAAFMVGAGYSGTLVMVDELVNIFKIPNSISRQNNYEKLLTMYNDALQGKAQHIGFLMGCTPQCVEDRYKGIFSYEALRSRLTEGHFSGDGRTDLTAPIIRLEMLSQEELYVLIEKLRDIHAQLYDYEPVLHHDDLVYFLTVEYNRVGADTHITPREIIRDFIELVGILHQNPETSIQAVLGSNSFEMAKGGLTDEDVHSEFAEFEL
ncbi:ATP-binding protein [Raoultibacter phocaeensis]|uniref:ATP-binding protein n=1 Tax=Raoultibacter phocaeensis TaxID=2479841 RepID=UPI001117D42C|nr:ATP-binding protein [Raoultibacter phocaeensis]